MAAHAQFLFIDTSSNNLIFTYFICSQMQWISGRKIGSSKLRKILSTSRVLFSQVFKCNFFCCYCSQILTKKCLYFFSPRRKNLIPVTLGPLIPSKMVKNCPYGQKNHAKPGIKESLKSEKKKRIKKKTINWEKIECVALCQKCVTWC